MTRQLWRDHMNNISLDVDFINGAIHGRSCKKKHKPKDGHMQLYVEHRTSSKYQSSNN